MVNCVPDGMEAVDLDTYGVRLSGEEINTFQECDRSQPNYSRYYLTAHKTHQTEQKQTTIKATRPMNTHIHRTSKSKTEKANKKHKRQNHQKQIHQSCMHAI
jgi:hypothetical protein